MFYYIYLIFVADKKENYIRKDLVFIFWLTAWMEVHTGVIAFVYQQYLYVQRPYILMYIN